MANYCISNYVFTGKEEEISKLYSILTECFNTESLEDEWIGKIAMQIGLSPDNVYCRGWVRNINLKTKQILKLVTESAWSPCFQLFDLISKKFPSINYYFKATEPNCDVYLTNDREKKFFKYGAKYKLLNEDDINKHIIVERYINNLIDKDMVNTLIKQIEN